MWIIVLGLNSSMPRRENLKSKRFGVLSIDAEGVGDKVLHAWIDGGYRPEMIVYEKMHNVERFDVTKAYLEGYGYKYLIKLGFNHIPIEGLGDQRTFTASF